MDTEAATHLAKTRVQDDTKLLKSVLWERKSIREFYRLSHPDLSPDQLEAAHATFLIGLDQLSQQLAKPKRIRTVTRIEVSGYQDDALALERTARETIQSIEALRTRLGLAQQERARRIEYDAIARTIKKLPDRAKGSEAIAKLHQDIALLESEEATYSSTWAHRQASFDSIVRSLETMSEAIRLEKLDQDRRKALEENDEDDQVPNGGVLAGAAGAGAGEDSMGKGGVLNPNAASFEPGGEIDGEQHDADLEEGEEGEMGHAGTTP
ncbi:BZ3500_MvSof-1268-A1-R1_Chr9g10780 [Microbotryum saponariae]|uniref:BZ3500_MvSof-1268-A1-R1_Chr9g10780 protein n=1 Tax=Microbotryum saponariae TaxID=289078 RepID=A0A2X0L3T9_9BASI|nr:BZ3501_MvSof-1269-A2-R1_Chr9g10528 [Microbotryum saponariae]SDA00676.1 BZ3500_MvSof-1268-A1-R1_Chr9g10780 [Microbotryum saponariae]